MRNMNLIYLGVLNIATHENHLESLKKKKSSSPVSAEVETYEWNGIKEPVRY